jgi:hypothetical protein
MINCVSIFFSWDTFKLYVINAVKCVLTFWYACCLSSVQHYVICVLWNWLFYTGDSVMCAVISCSVSNIGFVSFKCNPSLLILHIWYFSNVFKCFPPFSIFIMSTVGYSAMCMFCSIRDLNIQSCHYYF